MRYTQLEKEYLGKLFTYYRKTKQVKWNQIKQANITSASTYSKIEKGNPVKNHFIYDDYLKFYGLTFKRKVNDIEWLKEYLPKTVHAFIWNEMNLFDELHQELEKELNDYKTTPIYEQLYTILTHLFNYYQNGQYMTEDEIKKCILLLQLEIYPYEDLEALLLELMAISNNNAIGKYEIIDEIKPLLKKYDNNLIINYILALYEKCEANFHSALVIYEKTYEHWNNIGNHYRKIRNYMGIYTIYKNIDTQKSQSMSIQLLKYCDDPAIPSNIKKNMIYNVAIFYYLTKKYQNSYNLFMRIIKEYQGTREMEFIGSICTHLRIEIPEEFDEIDYSSSSNKKIIKYFHLKKQQVSTDILVHYIMDVIVPEELIKQNYIHPNWSMFEYELEELARKDRKVFKFYLEFKEIMHKTCIDG